MAKPLRIGAAVLAAGASRRFGEEDKLAQPFRGRPLGEHVVEAIPVDRIAEDDRWIVVSRLGHPCATAWQAAGFQSVVNTDAMQGIGTSVSTAGMLAIDADLDGLIIALADMPLVPREHFGALIDAFADPSDIVCSSNGASRTPPAIIGSEHFSALAQQSGDTGARDLLARGQTIDCPSEWLIDIDTRQALQTYGQAPAAQPKPPLKGDN